MKNDTIFALSSAAGQAGVAVIRVSGKNVLDVYNILTNKDNPKIRYLQCNYIFDKDKAIIDQAMTVYFKGPKSFTGEDVLEIHCHGSRAVINKILSVLSEIPNCRMAERGEFTRRAVYNGKMDLTSAEGLIDLIHSDTEQQRKWAVRQMGGQLQKLYDSWRAILTQNRAYLEAFIDFPEEEIPPEKMTSVENEIKALAEQISTHLDDKNRGQALRRGFQIAIIGAPNVGKSSLLSCLAQREAAIVSDIAGTTRDVVDVYLDIAGYPVIISDTAGLHDTDESIEKEGIRRALIKAEEADLVLALNDCAHAPQMDSVTQKSCEKLNEINLSKLKLNDQINIYNIFEDLKDVKVIVNKESVVWNKADMAKKTPTEGIWISAKTGQGIDALQAVIAQKVTDKMSGAEDVMITRVRYKEALNVCLDALKRFLTVPEIELKAEELRTATTALGKITGAVSTEELLDIIFSSFCIGK